MEDDIDGLYIRLLLSKNLKRLRTMIRISQMDLANEANLAPNFVNDIENGKKWVSAATLAKLAAALKVEPHQLFLSLDKWKEPGNEGMGVYINDMTDSFQKMVGEKVGEIVSEFRQTYLPGHPAKLPPEPPAKLPSGGEAGSFQGKPLLPKGNKPKKDKF